MGDSERPTSVAGVIAKLEVTEFPHVAVIVAFTAELTGVVLTENVALVAPAGTETVPGTVAVEELLASVTVAPPVGATAPNVTVPVDELPPGTDTRDNDNVETPKTVIACVAEGMPV